MTFLGRILVVVNFVFAVIAASLMIMVHASSARWADVANKTAKELQVAQANAQTYKDEIDKVRAEESAKVTAVQAKLAETEKARDDFQIKSQTFSNQYAKELELRKALETSRDSITAEQGRRKLEIDQLHGLLATRDKRMLELEQEKQALRNRAVLAEIASKSEQERNEGLLRQVETMTREMQRAQVSGGTSPAGLGQRNPPPVDVRGIVTRTDPSSGYITISVGSDAGLVRGHTLEVYRTEPQPAYLGTVRVEEVRSSEAVVRPLGPQRLRSIKPGDTVASSINARP